MLCNHIMFKQTTLVKVLLRKVMKKKNNNIVPKAFFIFIFVSNSNGYNYITSTEEF